MVPPGDILRKGETPDPARKRNAWDRMEKWQQMTALVVGAVASLFGAGVSFQRARASIVMISQQKPVDERQDAMIRAITDDNGKLHVSMDHLHEEVRGMRTDLRYFDPRIRGGGLGALPEEMPHPTPTSAPTPAIDPSMGFAIPTPRTTGSGG